MFREGGNITVFIEYGLDFVISIGRGCLFGRIYYMECALLQVYELNLKEKKNRD